jgi:hypothetical protein
VDLKVVEYIIALVKRSLNKEVHIFSLDFSTALLANIFHAKSTLNFLQKPENHNRLAGYVNDLLSLIERKNIPASVLMHCLISLNYLNHENLKAITEARCNFTEAISSFVEVYSRKCTKEKENDEIDKRTVLDLCAHMFHPKDLSGNDLSQSLDYNDMRQDDKIREFENEQGDLIFECFQDESEMFEK